MRDVIMSQIKVLKDPGFIYDLLFVFYLKFNKKQYISGLDPDKNYSENVQYFNDILTQFSDISDDLYVFFHAIQDHYCFMTSCYFQTYKDLFITNFDFKFLQSKLSQKNEVECNLIRFYFPKMSVEEREDCIHSKVSLFAHIKSSRYTDEEKSKLYEFFINPDPYIQTLQYELMAKELILSRYYEKNYQKILDAQNKMTDEILGKQMKGVIDRSFTQAVNQEIYTSYCLINKFCLNVFSIQGGILYLLGYDYNSVLDSAKNQSNQVDLQSFGNGLCEESRVKILQLLLERPEATCKDLEKHFSFSGSTAYHHITILLKAGLVKTRNEGKTVLYSLNRNYFDMVINALSKFSNNRHMS